MIITQRIKDFFRKKKYYRDTNRIICTNKLRLDNSIYGGINKVEYELYDQFSLNIQTGENSMVHTSGTFAAHVQYATKAEIEIYKLHKKAKLAKNKYIIKEQVCEYNRIPDSSNNTKDIWNYKVYSTTDPDIFIWNNNGISYTVYNMELQKIVTSYSQDNITKYKVFNTKNAKTKNVVEVNDINIMPDLSLGINADRIINPANLLLDAIIKRERNLDLILTL